MFVTYCGIQIYLFVSHFQTTGLLSSTSIINRPGLRVYSSLYATNKKKTYLKKLFFGYFSKNLTNIKQNIPSNIYCAKIRYILLSAGKYLCILCVMSSEMIYRCVFTVNRRMKYSLLITLTVGRVQCNAMQTFDNKSCRRQPEDKITLKCGL